MALREERISVTALGLDKRSNKNSFKKHLYRVLPSINQIKYRYARDTQLQDELVTSQSAQCLKVHVRRGIKGNKNGVLCK